MKKLFSLLLAVVMLLSVAPVSNVYFSDFAIEAEAATKLPSYTKLGKIANAKSGVNITWSKATGATSYVIYRKTSKTSYKAIKTVSSKYTSFTDKTVKSGTKYTYTVKAKNSKGYGKYNSTGLSKYYLATPEIKTMKNVVGGIKVTWTKVKGATGYKVMKYPVKIIKAGDELSSEWYYDKKNTKTIATIKKQSTTSYTDKSVKNGSLYVYIVVAYYGKTYSAKWESYTTVYLAPTEITYIKSTSSGIYLEWKFNPCCESYVIYRKSGNGEFEHYDCVNNLEENCHYYDRNVYGGTYSYYVKPYYMGGFGSHKNVKSCTDIYW